MDKQKNVIKAINRTVTALAILIAVVIVVTSSIVVVPTGYTGVRTTFGQIDSTVVPSGFNLKIPFVQRIIKINNKQQESDCSHQVWSETSSRTAIYYEGITVTYQITPSRSAWIVANVSDYSNLIDSNILHSAVKSSSVTLRDAEATNRTIVEPLIAENLQKLLDEKYGDSTVYIIKCTVSNVDFEDSYNEAIAAKQTATLEAERQAIVNQQNIDKAEADAKVRMTQAQAEADAMLIKAKAEAEANEIISESLTDRIIQQNTIDKWNGELPKVTGSDSGLMIDLNSLDEVSE